MSPGHARTAERRSAAASCVLHDEGRLVLVIGTQRLHTRSAGAAADAALPARHTTAGAVRDLRWDGTWPPPRQGGSGRGTVMSPRPAPATAGARWA